MNIRAAPEQLLARLSLLSQERIRELCSIDVLPGLALAHVLKEDSTHPTLLLLKSTACKEINFAGHSSSHKNADLSLSLEKYELMTI